MLETKDVQMEHQQDFSRGGMKEGDEADRDEQHMKKQEESSTLPLLQVSAKSQTRRVTLASLKQGSDPKELARTKKVRLQFAARISSCRP